MEVRINISEYEAKERIKEVMHDVIKERIEPLVVKWLDENINNDEVAKIIEQRIRETLSYGAYQDRNMGCISQMLEERILEVSMRITDDDLKNTLLQKFLKMTKVG